METIDRVRTRENGVRRKSHRVWDAMIQRCTNPKNNNYKRYGGRGIKVCDEWRDYQNFYRDMGEPPEGKEIDRIDNNGNYEKINCRWVSRKENVRNSSRVNLVTYHGKERSLAEWEEITGQKANSILTRLRRGWPVGEALGIAPHHPKNKLSNEEKKKRERECVVCGEIFIPRIQQIKNGQGTYCSQTCNASTLSKRRWAKHG